MESNFYNEKVLSKNHKIYTSLNILKIIAISFVIFYHIGLSFEEVVLFDGGV